MMTYSIPCRRASWKSSLHRGHHYAGKACKLLFQLAQRHGMEYVIITCNPDNYPSSLPKRSVRIFFTSLFSFIATSAAFLSQRKPIDALVTVLLCIQLETGTLFSHGTRYDIEF